MPVSNVCRTKPKYQLTSPETGRYNKLHFLFVFFTFIIIKAAGSSENPKSQTFRSIFELRVCTLGEYTTAKLSTLQPAYINSWGPHGEKICF